MRKHVAISTDEDNDSDSGAARRGSFEVTNLVSNIPGLANAMDPNVKNPWGMASAPGGQLWVASNGGNASTIYALNGEMPVISPLVVKLAQDPESWKPTGMVFNPRPDLFVIPGTSVGATFIFVSEEGRIVAWNPAGKSNATVIKPATKDAVYKGLALGVNADGVFIFATNFHAGTVEVFDASFAPVHRYRFIDRDLPRGYAPFGIANIDGNLFVSFALQDPDKQDDVAGDGHGFVAVFTTSGKLIRRLVSRGPLDSPWGMVRAPLDFGQFGGALLIGNFGNGQINAFDNRGSFLGELRTRNGNPLMINGLWSLMFGTFQGADPADLYFTAGINGESDGLIGEISLVSGRH
jgi:uncharacterized protein (TIGR03118 family)